jgi:hypothetical protein
MTYAHPESGPNSPTTADVNTPAVNAVPASRVGEPRAPSAGSAMKSLFLGGFVVLVAAFVAMGILITWWLFVLPVVVLGSVFYLVRSARPGAPRREAPRRDPHDSVPSKSGVRGGSAQ